MPDQTRRDETLAVLSLAQEHLELTTGTEKIAEELEKCGIGAIDAIHLALASQAKAEFFCTTDDKFLRKAQTIEGLGCKVISLLGLVAEVTK
jgi:predicted nucleic acid-binding protein